MTALSFERFSHCSHGFNTREYHVAEPKQLRCPWWFVLQAPRIETFTEIFEGRPRYSQRYVPAQSVLIRRAGGTVVKDGNVLPVGVSVSWLDIGQDPRVQAAVARNVPNRSEDEALIRLVLEKLAEEEGNAVPRETEAAEGGEDQSTRPTETFPPSPPIYETKSGIRFRPEEVSQLELLGLVDRAEIDSILGQCDKAVVNRGKRNARSL